LHRIAVIGCGYVGLVTGTCFAELGNQVVCVENDPARFEALAAGGVPFYEPGLSELVARNRARKRLSFARDVRTGIGRAQIVFIAVGTPMLPSGLADLTYVRAVAREIAEALDGPKLVVNKSTVPVETGDLVAAIIREFKRFDHPVQVVSNPEFLREGSAIADFMHPDRIVIGSHDAAAETMLRDLYAPLAAPIIVTDVRTAEMIKYTANAFLAAKISFVNEIAAVCERVGADIKDVVTGAGADRRIGSAFMNAGLGFGGSCFPKDVRALCGIAAQIGVATPLLDAVLRVNAYQVERSRERLAQALAGLAGRRIAVLGLAFKPETDDVRESQAIALALALQADGASLAAHDPIALETARRVLGERVDYFDDPYDAAAGADALVVATDWNEYKQLDFERVRATMRGNLVFDARNACDPREIGACGLVYLGVGRNGERVGASWALQ
jgi:UDPglucose 6-dehydrogenase